MDIHQQGILTEFNILTLEDVEEAEEAGVFSQSFSAPEEDRCCPVHAISIVFSHVSMNRWDLWVKKDAHIKPYALIPLSNSSQLLYVPGEDQ